MYREGAPVPGATVALYRYDWQRRHTRAEERQTDAEGRVRFAYGPGKFGNAYFLLARKGAEVALDADAIRFVPPSEPGSVRTSLIYTDRTVYRPMQKVFWKVLLYGGSPGEGRFRTLPGESLTVSLRDPNGQVVESQTLAANAFGTASGEFSIPTGRVLGSWTITDSFNGAASIRVEEYKRPTFEVSLRDPDAPLRLNRPAAFTGEARYYFGLPVVAGTVKWRVTMEPEFPWWWDWHGWGDLRRREGRIVASGTSGLAPDGTFKVSFTPEADERLAAASKEVTYRYRVAADLTDEGGETRSAARSFRLGFVSVEAAIDLGPGFLEENRAGSGRIRRTDLNGAPRAGKGSWRLVALAQPEHTLLPAD